MGKLNWKDADKIMQITTSWHEKGRIEGRALGWAEGKAEGRIEGKVEQTQEIICKYLTIRFGMDSSEVKNKVQEINLVIFEHLLTELFDANSREEARTILWAAMK